MAGAIQRRIVGPIWMNGSLVTELWLGDADDPPAGEVADFTRAANVTLATGLTGAALAIAILLVR